MPCVAVVHFSLFERVFDLFDRCFAASGEFLVPIILVGTFTRASRVMKFRSDVIDSADTCLALKSRNLVFLTC